MDGNRRVYLLHPNSSRLPGIDSWINEVRVLIGAEANWAGWTVDATSLDDRGRIEVQPYWVRVKNRPGPVVLLEPHQRKILDGLAERLGLDVVVIPRSASDSTDLYEAVEDARRRCIAGEPLLPRRLVVAVLIVRKLRRYHYWSGNAKGYLWASELAKGRGVDDRFADIAQDVAGYMLTHGVLVYKISNGQRKIALNPDKKPEVHAIADRAYFQNADLRKLLYKDADREPASCLVVSNVTQKITLQIPGRPALNLPTVSAALLEARSSPEGVPYEASAQVHYDDGHTISEKFDDRVCLLQFLQALAS